LNCSAGTTRDNIYKIPDFIRIIEDLENDPNCNSVGNNIDIFTVYDESRLFFPTLENIKLIDLETLTSCELLALKFCCTNQKTKIQKLLKKGRF